MSRDFQTTYQVLNLYNLRVLWGSYRREVLEESPFYVSPPQQPKLCPCPLSPTHQLQLVVPEALQVERIHSYIVVGKGRSILPLSRLFENSWITSIETNFVGAEPTSPMIYGRLMQLLLLLQSFVKINKAPYCQHLALQLCDAGRHIHGEACQCFPAVRFPTSP